MSIAAYLESQFCNDRIPRVRHCRTVNMNAASALPNCAFLFTQLTDVQICALLGCYAACSGTAVPTVCTAYRSHLQGSRNPKGRRCCWQDWQCQLDFFNVRYSMTVTVLVLRVAVGWTVRGSNPGGGDVFRAFQTGHEDHLASCT